jgi:hypothetical protein
MPFSVIILKMTVFQSMTISSEGMPSNAIRAQDRSRVARVLHAVEHHHQRVAGHHLFQRPCRRAHQRQHSLRAFGRRQIAEYLIADHARFRELRGRRFRRDHGMDFAARRARFREQMHSFGHGVTVLGERAPGHGAPDLFHKRVLIAEGVHYNDSERPA